MRIVTVDAVGVPPSATQAKIRMIKATIWPTRPFRDDRLGQEIEQRRSVPTIIRGGVKTSALDPVVLMRGCSEIRLDVVDSQVQHVESYLWTATPLAENLMGLSPVLHFPLGSMAKLSTDARGLYRITATVHGPFGVQVSYHWYVRFIDIVIPAEPSNLLLDTFKVGLGGQTGVKTSTFHATVSGDTEFGLTTQVILLGANDAPAQYNRVSLGVLQNLFTKTGEMGCETLHGIYEKRKGNNVLTGRLIEPVLPEESPHLDVERPSATYYPLFESVIGPTTGNSRTLSMNDGPGVMLPKYFDPVSGSTRRRRWREEQVSKETADDETSDYYTLVRIKGCLKFTTAIVAYTDHAPENYVVSEIHLFTMQVDTGRFTLDRNPPDTPCMLYGGRIILARPTEPPNASMESYGPTSVETGGTYDWMYG